MAGDGKSRKTSWKAKAHGQRARSPSARWIGRFLITLLAVALLSLLGYVLIDSRRSSLAGTKLLAIHPDAADLGQTSGLSPFAIDDCRAFEAFEKNKKLKRVKVIPWKEAGFGSTLSKQIGELKCEKNDVLIVYMTGAGISRDEKACLVCRDADLRPAAEDAAVQIFEVRKLLKQVGSCPGQKLLVLDVAGLGNDPWLGMLVNDFPLLLEKEVKDCGHDDLWVLNSAGMFQIGRALYSQRRSLFAMAVEEALQGRADANTDGKIRLLEFYEYVIRRCTGPLSDDDSTDDAGVVDQTPLLIHGGSGIVRSKIANQWVGDDSHDPILMRTAASGSPDDKKAATASGEKDKPAAAEPAKTASRTQRRDWLGIASGGHLAVAGSSRDTRFHPLIRRPPLPLADIGTQIAQSNAAQPPAEKAAAVEAPAKDMPASRSAADGAPADAPPGKGPEPQSRAGNAAGVAAGQPPSDPPDLSPNLKILLDAWRLRDEIQDRKLGDHWSAVDFGPHYWRRLNATLVAIEQGVLAGADSARHQPRLQDILEVLQELKSVMQAGRFSSKMPNDDVIAAWNQFQKSRSENKQ